MSRKGAVRNPARTIVTIIAILVLCCLGVIVVEFRPLTNCSARSTTVPEFPLPPDSVLIEVDTPIDLSGYTIHGYTYETTASLIEVGEFYNSMGCTNWYARTMTGCVVYDMLPVPDEDFYAASENYNYDVTECQQSKGWPGTPWWECTGGKASPFGVYEVSIAGRPSDGPTRYHVLLEWDKCTPWKEYYVEGVPSPWWR